MRHEKLTHRVYLVNCLFIEMVLALKGALFLKLLWLVLGTLALPTSDGLQPPWQGLHEVQQGFVE
jgi:hypothetical protein